MMKEVKGTIFFALFSIYFLTNVYAEYPVVCKETQSLLIENGKCKRNKGILEQHFIVDEENNVITRTNVINTQTGKVSLDNSQYTIFHNEFEFLGREYLGVRNPSGFLLFILRILDRNPKKIEQRIIKAFGRVGLNDGYELLVIGDDFVNQSRSTLDYFVVVHSKRYE